MNSVLYNHADGNFLTPLQIGPTIRWLDAETRGRLYKRTYRQRASQWQPQALGAPGPEGGWLIEESQPSDKGAGLVEWERTWALLPPTRAVGESIVFNYQEISGTDIIEAPIPTTAIVAHTWFHTLDPSVIPVLKATRYVKFGNLIYLFGQPRAAGQDIILAEDSRLRNWRGHLYERTAPYVRISALSIA